MSQHPTLATFDPAPILADFTGLPTREVAEILDVPVSTVKHWRAGRVGLKAKRADELAIRIGSHPAVLWPGQWWTP